MKKTAALLHKASWPYFNQVFFICKLNDQTRVNLFVTPLKLFAELVKLNTVYRGTDLRSVNGT